MQTFYTLNAIRVDKQILILQPKNRYKQPFTNILFITSRLCNCFKNKLFSRAYGINLPSTFMIMGSM